ncbi:MAG: MFS transporter [Ginsengibacter sp.]
MLKKDHPRLIYRISVGSLFFLLGFCFSSWASRIPTIRQKLDLSDSELGMVLFALPIGLLLSLLVSGRLINKFGSKKIVISAILIYAVILLGIGYSNTTFQLASSLFFFGFVGNLVNISVNTQALGVEALYQRSIMASFHGIWSIAGFTGAAIGTIMTGKNIIPFNHFLLIAAIVFIAVAINFRFTLAKDFNAKPNQPLVFKFEKSLINLGLIAFCSMICEGAMFDWSGVYFDKVLKVDKAWIGAGYTAFMLTMATGRFIADWFTNKFGLKFTLQLSGILTASGLLIAVIFPYLITSVIGFFLVGFGVSSVVPLVYSVAGKSKVLSAGTALSAVSTIGFLGFLLGPPVIGIIAGATSLRVSFTLIAFMGLCITIIASNRKFD